MRLLILTTALAAVAFGANPPAIQWQRTFGDSHNYGSCVQQTHDGGFIVTGVSAPDTLPTGYPASAPPGLLCPNILLLRTDSQGNTLWERSYGGPDEDRARAVRQTPDRGFVFCGRMDTRLASSRAVVVKLDSLGNVQWTDSVPGRAGAYDVGLTADGGYISVGGAVFDSIYLRKLDSQGNLQWHVELPEIKYPGGPFLHSPQTVQQTSDGGYITSYETVLKTDSLGNLQWSREHSDISVLFSIRQTTDGGYIATGIAPDPQKPEHEYNLVLLKMDAQGNKTWKRLYRDDGPTDGRCVRQTPDGGYFVVGESDGTYLLRANAQGHKLWAGRIPGVPPYRARWGERTADGGYIVAVGYVLVKLAPDGY